MSQIIRDNGFTNETLGWASWLPIVNPEQASPEQLDVLKESHPKAMTSEYYLTLIHQPEVLRQRSLVFNAIMYAPGGLPRYERELASTVVSRVNHCVYCASVHAQRFEQLAKRNEVVAEIFADPATAGGNPREQAIIRFSIDLTLDPGAIGPEHLQPLRDVGLNDGEILDLIQAVAIFAWANRLMLNLGDPVYSPESA
ncbi:peroxidase-related enzyme [Pseudomonas sp. DTU_2021_1001937_2_SI_NGA_ILE_001]|uniref:peroxidase-related enzyme n=1 Tax=Pseudomonas sp. DTU_2021_1001937_2_SI_NGA_ILE_001 TaxID=3077589 RepID=UPI0028FC1CCE|nr:peroxidase-related enzyme [Pseudomonas sp. DTU_2021_1001937_2_SI_NGA_ILE_001]WNW13426.1 peroxidase-related enzyme [Pseudomonas sp. DTU_2021_1001937_2_SI_NGA_ILE_001]